MLKEVRWVLIAAGVLVGFGMPAMAQTAPDSTASSAAAMQEGDFVIDGASYAKVLYLEGNVWIKPPGETTFHKLTEDEPIAAQSTIYTGFNGTLDFAVGPGMAVRMVPATGITVDELPRAIPGSGTYPPAPPAAAPSGIATPTPTPTPAPASPQSAQIALKRGTVFSALGREDNAPVDFKVSTPQGIAGARGTMFSTTVMDGESQVSMLHGTVNFETPDHQTTQIGVGQSQRISGSSGKFKFAKQETLSPKKSEAFFNHAGGLLEHASGHGAVRRGLGPEVVKGLQAKGYKLPQSAQDHFQNAAKVHYKTQPAFNHARVPHGGSSTGPGGNKPGGENHSGATSTEHGNGEKTTSHPGENRSTSAKSDEKKTTVHPTPTPAGSGNSTAEERRDALRQQEGLRRDQQRDRFGH
jgi:hypothetical protein